MTVKELIEQLQMMPQESIVIIQKDAGGNRYSPLSCADHNTIYKADNTWDGEVYSTKWNADDVCMDKEEWENFKKNTPACIVLVPTN